MKLLIVLLGVLGLTYAQNCAPTEFECDNGRCIPDRWICDGDNDCGDMSDERNCPSTTTTPCPGFRCPNTGRCLPASYQCDGDNDCGDWSDETDCADCRGRECDNNVCIPDRRICDGNTDCNDGSDEENCPTTTTTPCAGFTCPNTGRCIPSSYVCDGDNDCGDGSDERWEPGMPGFNCPGTDTCIPERRVCDGNDDCGDGSDETEEACPCAEGEYRCAKPPGSNVPGPCIPPEWVCDEDGIWDCPDGSDEANCTMSVRTPHHPKTKPIRVRQSSIQKLLKLTKENGKEDRERRQRKAEALYAFNHYRPQKQKKL